MRRSPFLCTLSLLAILTIVPPLYSQYTPVRFSHLTVAEGLSENTITYIVQDQVGFMWFGTTDGLNRYDGHTFSIFRHDATDDLSLSHHFIEALILDREGTLWIGTNDGLNKFDHDTESFTRYLHDPDDENSLADNNIASLFEDREGAIWIGTTGGGLSRFDKKTDQFTNFFHDPQNPQSLSHNVVYALHEDRQGTLWIGTQGGGLNRFDPATQSFVHYQHQPDEPESLSHNVVWTITEDVQGNLWVGTYGGGLNVYNPTTDSFKRYVHQPDSPQSLSNDLVTVLYTDRKGNLWIGTDGGGLNLFDAQQDTFVHFKNDPGDLSSLSKNVVRSIFEDNKGNLWVGTYVGGINFLENRANAFAYYTHNANDPQSLSNNSVLSFLEDQQGRIWIGTDGGGLNLLNLNPNDATKPPSFTHYKHDPNNPNSLSSNAVLSLLQDRKGQVWVGTYAGGVNRLDPATGTFVHHRHDAGNPNSLSSDHVWTLYEDQHDHLWLGTQDHGISVLNPATQKFSFYTSQPENTTSLIDPRIRVFQEDRQGNLWVGTFRGVERYHPEQDTFTHYSHNPNDSTSLSNDWVFSIFEDRRGTIWVGTVGGLNRFNAAEESFTSYREHDGLPNDVISCILEDDHENLWLGTNQGLSKLSLQTEAIHNFDLSTGLQSNQFNIGACLTTQTGHMLFGSTDGFYYFHPDSIKVDQRVPPIVLTSFKVFNEPAQLDTVISVIKEIQLRHDEKVFSFDFVALDFSPSRQNRYRYQMEGFNDDWINLGAKHDVTFTNLDPKTYTFRATGTNSHGVWSEEGVSVKVTIVPPFWQTWWFRLLGLASLIGGLVSIVRLRTRAVENRNVELQKEVTERKQAESLLEESLSLLQSTFESTADGILVVGENRKIVGYNEKFVEMWGFAESDLKIRDSKHLVSTILKDLEDPEAFVSRLKVLYTEPEMESFDVLRFKDGRVFERYSQPQRIGKSIIGRVWSFRDVTEPTRVAAEREALIEELETKNAELERFTYTVSHDLKSPLVTIRGFLGLLEKDVSTGNKDRMKRDFEQINTATEKMQQLLNELLELSRIGHVVNPLEEVSLSTLADEATNLVAGRITARGVQIEFLPDLPLVYVDRSRMVEVFQNLIDNAVKFMGEQPNPSIEIGAKEEDKRIACYVRDNGIGIPPKYHDKVFGLFERLNPQDDGTGIGLALVKRIVEIHGGRIWIVSDGKNEGSTFWFTLPRNGMSS